MSLRFPIAIGLGLVSTFGLFWIMQALIGVDAELQEARPSLSVDFVRLRRDTTPETKEREPPKREKPEQQPPPPQMNLSQNINPDAVGGDVIPIGDPSAEIQQATAIGAGHSESSAVPLVRVDPEYPPRALQRGVRGWVVVQFTITPSGTVEDVEVLDSSPPGVFEQSVMRAVRRWRYNPMIVDGKPVARKERTRLRFEPPGA